MPLSVTSPAISDPARAWQVLSDVRHWPEWLPTVTEVTPLEPDAPDWAGAAYRFVQPRLGAARWEVTEWEPGRQFTWVSSRPGVTTTGTHELLPVPDGVQARLGISWSGPLAWLIRAAYGGLTQRYLEAEAAALHARCEPAREPGA